MRSGGSEPSPAAAACSARVRRSAVASERRMTPQAPASTAAKRPASSLVPTQSSTRPTPSRRSRLTLLHTLSSRVSPVTMATSMPSRQAGSSISVMPSASRSCETMPARLTGSSATSVTTMSPVLDTRRGVGSMGRQLSVGRVMPGAARSVCSVVMMRPIVEGSRCNRRPGPDARGAPSPWDLCVAYATHAGQLPPFPLHRGVGAALLHFGAHLRGGCAAAPRRLLRFTACQQLPGSSALPSRRCPASLTRPRSP